MRFLVTLICGCFGFGFDDVLLLLATFTPFGRVVFLFNKLLLLMLLLLDDDCGTFVLFFNEDDGCDVGAVLCFLIADDDDA